MLSRIAQTFVSVGVIAALLFTALQPAMAAQGQAQPKPSDFFWEEVMVGTVGGILGLSVAALTVYGCPAAVIDVFTVEESGTGICKKIDILDGYGRIVFYIVSLLILPTAVIIGINMDGSQHGVIANNSSTLLGAYLGFLIGATTLGVMGKIISSLNLHLWEINILGLFVVTGIDAFITTYFYNQGATMQNSQPNANSLQISMPFVSYTLRF